MSSENATIQQAIPVFIKAVILDDLVAVNKLLDAYPKLVQLKDSRDRNILMMAIYGIPHTVKKLIPTSKGFQTAGSTHNVLNYLISFYVIANDVLDIDAVDADGLNAYDWAVLAGNEFAISLLNKLKESDEGQ